ncbi:MAG: hypothetical protein US52_C0016G0004 [candidate division WS6 bacterium GW2011_GWA2_37_6]|uniref:NADAR domain-containing protein n=1 Tax=candidate division WS6 bacterium GW2011_GWA2_37_6 TaxID=1619087 RepID=A0A0G0H0N3_9BACT|nr:MAG: hypothetical protein US52_C0016G0004 [candidate division WS6 bacterium GW2011_GWA2_37_6]
MAKSITGKPLVVDNKEVVGMFEREFYMLSNWSAHQIKVKATLYPTLEHAYHAEKFEDKSIKQQILLAKSPLQSKEIAWANKSKMKKDWREIKVEVMERLCRLKLEQHKEVHEGLLRTGNRLIVEDSSVEDYWGIGSDKKGQNIMGKIWMKLREEII